jgi:zinc transport system substrate-binding protein
MISLTACNFESNIEKDNGKIKIISTIFPFYDFAKQIAGDKADVSMLLKPGSEPHAFEPSASDILNIKNCDLFLYVGGESDIWVDEILKSTQNINAIRLIDVVEKVEEETVEGMQSEEAEEEGEEETEYDEHIWTSIDNAITISERIKDFLVEIDKTNEDYYQNNFADYKENLVMLKNDFDEMFKNASTKELIFGDRFPFRYFKEEFNLTYYAAFPGCSSETEASLKTVAFLVNKIREDDVKTVFYLENSNHIIAEKLADETGAKIAMLHSCHNVSKRQFDDDITYIDLMRENLKTLKEGL